MAKADSGDEANAAPAPAGEVHVTQEGHVAMDAIAGVRYTGGADRRTLSVVDLQRVGVVGITENLEFNHSNNFTVEAKQINASARDWFELQPDFEIVLG